jgi:hypothetical protein
MEKGYFFFEGPILVPEPGEFLLKGPDGIAGFHAGGPADMQIIA